MPLGGINVGWDETVPADSENAGLGAQRIRSLETALQQVLDSEHNFPATGGANTGYHRFGSARAFYDVESNVSSSGTDGRLYVTSDTSRFFHVGSAGTMYLGDAQNVSAISAPPGGQQFYWAHDFGEAKTGTQAEVTVAFAGSGFSGVPFVQVSVITQASGPGYSGPVALAFVDALTKTNMRIFSGAANSASFVSVTNVTVHWSSIGTRVL